MKTFVPCLLSLSTRAPRISKVAPLALSTFSSSTNLIVAMETCALTAQAREGSQAVQWWIRFLSLILLGM